MKPLHPVFALLCLPVVVAAQETSQLQRLRTSYDSAVQRAVKPITEAYLKELTQLRDTYTRASRLTEAVQVDEEIKAVNAKLAAMGEVIAAPTGSKALALDTKVKIPANTPEGYRIGAVKQGDVITLQYVEGGWKGHGHIPTDNPDTQTGRDPESSLVIARGPEKGKPGDVITIVPAETAKKPFSFTFPTSRDEVVLRINKNSDNPKNPGAVTYRIKLMK